MDLHEIQGLKLDKVATLYRRKGEGQGDKGQHNINKNECNLETATNNDPWLNANQSPLSPFQQFMPHPLPNTDESPCSSPEKPAEDASRRKATGQTLRHFNFNKQELGVKSAIVTNRDGTGLQRAHDAALQGAGDD